ncbi:hydroxypyruvate isomerase family protein [Glycomyces harbinensis]|uniref:Hydroxypyruvate isomerase n=1 Tax=Glycomyces harbinensis TaxID=58114 RepID=A0A1G6W181_9ACTN|nr:TIM barrel protein [Glycomyces harbinensis]SDD59473.1 hydroxypyruvate isomerase [Glycomyces harbinensis]
MTTLRFDANLKWLFTEHEFEARFAAAANAGFTAVEYPSPYGHDAAHLRRLLADNGLEQILVNTPMGPAGSPTRQGLACIPGLVGEYRDGVLRGLEYATALGAPFLHVVGGLVPEGVSRDRAFARYVANIAWAAEQTEGTGVRLLLEAQNKRDAPGFILETQEQAAAVVEAVGPDRVGLLLDFYHAQIDEGDLIRTYQRFQDLVLHLQIADPPSRHEPGTGEIGWPALFAAVAASGYTGWIGCEYAPRTDTVAGLAWMKGYTA